MKKLFNKAAAAAKKNASGLARTFRRAALTAVFTLSSFLSVRAPASSSAAVSPRPAGGGLTLSLTESSYTHGGELYWWQHRQYQWLEKTADKKTIFYNKWQSGYGEADTSSTALQKHIRTINDRVNKRVSYVSDLDKYNVREYFASGVETIGDGQGDCDDYAIAKYLDLLHAGVDEDRLWLALILTPPEGHCVLLVDVSPDKSKTDLRVLDNAEMKILKLEETPYVPTYIANRYETFKVTVTTGEGFVKRPTPWQGKMKGHNCLDPRKPNIVN